MFTLAIGATSQSTGGLLVEENFNFFVGVSCLLSDVTLDTNWAGYLNEFFAATLTVGEPD
jgi:hypothetical protein